MCAFSFFVKRRATGWILTLVDDFIGGGKGREYWDFVARVRAKLKFDKWRNPREAPVDSGGRTLRQLGDFGFTVNMERYLEKRLAPIEIAPQRAKHKTRDRRKPR